ncbi:transposase [Priestia megaterium]|uniref:transposase n=1 Tax=Priestia megaterium TaxID=1404 RepID=UPI0023DC299C|nr:transposase [Priestia megaterium]MDF2056311.1 helix-turn-helix domain-containing protein [Priestia megaterium]MDF2060273.1 helix-turn-helix domain-containing protein [Priestia megaterium]
MAKGKYEKWITEEGLVLLEGWARNGLTDEQIAHNVGVSRSTLNDWKKKYPDISDALKKGKEVVDLQVENALLKRALGYAYEEVTEESQWNEKAKQYELVITKRVRKRQAPDTTAQIFWLKNRRPDKWRDKQDVEHTGDMDLNIVIDYGEDND